MEEYYARLNTGLTAAIAVAQQARRVGIDPSTDVEIPIANDLADRVEAQVGIIGVAARIRELEAEMSREEASLRIGDDFVARMFGEESPEEILDHAIRTSMALLTEGVVSAPIEGIAKIALAKNDDGTNYLKIYYAGPIRSAGGTAQALSVLVGDYVRRLLKINRYIPREEEIERYIEEIRQYNSIMSLQYLPSKEEIRLIITNCPVCIDGEPTEKEEVSGYRNLERVETNVVRGGMALVIAEGLALKAPKVQKNVKKMKMDGWDWLEDIIHVTAGGDDEGPESGIAPKDKFLRDLIGGRPVFSYPMRPGGFRLRYGRSRNTGLAAGGLNPASLHILGDFLAVGTQLKTERPGKAAGVAPVDTIEGPTVRLINGDVVRVHTAQEAKKLHGLVSYIIDVGEILISYGEFMENNHILVPPAYCEEWWLLEGGPRHPDNEEEAISFAEEGAYLHPEYTLLFDDLTPDQIRYLASYIRTTGTLHERILSIPVDPKIKDLLEILLLPHQVREGMYKIPQWRVFVRCLGLNQDLSQSPAWLDTLPADPLEMVMHLSGFLMRSKAGTRIGGRMGRPGKSKPREMKPAPHVLFPVGETGGSRRSLQESAKYAYVANKDGGVVTLVMGVRRCPECREESYQNTCQQCGTHTTPVFSCPRCNREETGAVCSQCGAPLVCSREYSVNIKQELINAFERLGIRDRDIPLVKGVKGLISKEKPVEMLEKGILRSLNSLWVFKDGTVRFDMIDMPLTHFRPREVGVSIQRLSEIGYTYDIYGKELTDSSQILELPPQDILISEGCADYLIRVATFLDKLLSDVYHLPPFYCIENREELVGHLVIGLAPHTSAGVLARIVGYSKANVGYGHPFFHAAKRRNCFFGDTSIEVYDTGGIRNVPVREFVLSLFDLNNAGNDICGTYYSDPATPAYARSIDTAGVPHIRKVTSVSVHPAPTNLIRITSARGKELLVTPDHAMLLWDLTYLRKIRALELCIGDPVPIWEGGVVLSDRITEIEYVPAPEPLVYCLTVEVDHTVVANNIFCGQCDGDEDCVMLLLDGFMNFSRSFLPETRGGTMDAPLVLSSRIDPNEIDKESHNVDVCAGYPLELYQKSLLYAHPRDVEPLIDRVEQRLGKPSQVEGFFFTHDTSDISAGPLNTMYTQLKSMLDKLECELDLARKIRAVDADDVAERVLQTHFIRDLQGNLNAFSKQKFRCTKCNTSYRRMPLIGKCTVCGSNIIPTVHEGSVKKYLQMSRDICTNYAISEYTRQRVEVIEMNIESTFGEEKVEQLGLADFL